MSRTARADGGWEDAAEVCAGLLAAVADVPAARAAEPPLAPALDRLLAEAAALARRAGARPSPSALRRRTGTPRPGGTADPRSLLRHPLLKAAARNEKAAPGLHLLARLLRRLQARRP